MTKKTRRRFSGSDKVAILKRHLIDREPISDICDELGINPNLFYRWQIIFFENGAHAFDAKGSRSDAPSRRLTDLQQKLLEKNDVISELASELVKAKKNIGEI